MTKHKVEVSLHDLAQGKKIPLQSYDPKDLTARVQNLEPQPFHFNFASGNQIVGQLTININGHMTFTGKADMAAREFFDHVIARHAPYEKAMLVMAAAHKLVACKGRYHSQLNYEALAKLLGVDRPAVSAWHDSAMVRPIFPESQVIGEEVLTPSISVLTRWEGIAEPCVGWYMGNGTFQHADGTCEGEVGWGGIVYRCVAWTEIPE